MLKRNDMKKIMTFALTALLMGGLSLGVTSCKDDDDNNNGNGNGEEQVDGTMDAAGRFWAVAANLVSPFDVTAEYENKTFEPTIGEPLNGNETVRMVNATNLAVAAEMFASMTGAPVTESTTSYTFQDDAVGTMTYQKSTDGKSLATVDVSIKQIPHLQRIVYMTPEQMPENANTTGVPYYSFGDVISRPNADGKLEYWVCIHPAFTPQGQNDTYWATVSPLPKANIVSYHGSNGKDYNMPTSIGNNAQRMQDLAELLWALYEPEQWEENTKQAACPLPFGDIKKENVKYINQYFWQRVRTGWNEKNIGKMLFGMDWLPVSNSLESYNGGLHLLYKGYSWWFKTSNNLSLYERIYMNGEGKKANAHEMSERELKKEVIKNNIEVNCVTQYTESHWKNEAFFGSDKPRFIFRTATGKQLVGMNPGPYTTMRGGEAGISDIYVYTQRYGIPVGRHVDMEELDNLSATKSHYHTGDVYQDEEGHHWIVTYMGGSPYDGSPYTELVSFDAMKYSADGAYVTNAPTKDEVLRGFPFLWFLGHSTNALLREKEFKETDASLAPTLLRNMMKAGFDPRTVFQTLVREDGARNETHTCSLPYRVDGDTKQRLLRMVMTSDNAQNDLKFNYWEHYPSVPSATAKYCTDFSPVPIYLQDVANQSMVDGYGKDYYAARPLSVWGKTGETRQYRTKADSKAKDVRNYTYNMGIWEYANYPTAMWNDPLFVACYDAVIDRGGENYNTKTVKGHTLTPMFIISIVENEDDIDVNKTDIPHLQHFWDTMKFVLTNDAFSVDGKIVKQPSYKIWGE